MNISYFHFRAEGINWFHIDLNANILARNVHFLQIKESFTHSAFVIKVSSIKLLEKTQYLMLHFEKKGNPEMAYVSASRKHLIGWTTGKIRSNQVNIYACIFRWVDQNNILRKSKNF